MAHMGSLIHGLPGFVCGILRTLQWKPPRYPLRKLRISQVCAGPFLLPVERFSQYVSHGQNSLYRV